MSAYTTYPLTDLHAQLFTGPGCGAHGWATLPKLLRQVAGWLAEQAINDSRVEGVTVATVFASEGDGGEPYLTITIYYRDDNGG